MMAKHKHPEKPEGDGQNPPVAQNVPEALVDSDEVLEAQPIEEAGCGCGECGSKEGPSAEDELKTEIKGINDRYLRLAADFDNFRKRQAKERQDLVAYANESMVLDILPVLDNLERALAASVGPNDSADGMAGVRKGVELTMRMFQQILARNGVERMKVVGEKFDPRHHEALAQVLTDELDPETVAEEAEAGYSLNGRVIRPAKVKVAKPPAPAPQEDEEEVKAKEE